jgi:hypothetical protein
MNAAGWQYVGTAALVFIVVLCGTVAVWLYFSFDEDPREEGGSCGFAPRQTDPLPPPAPPYPHTWIKVKDPEPYDWSNEATRP